MSTSIRTIFWAGVGYLLVIGIVFLPALFPQAGMMIHGDDIHRQYYFYREFFNTWIGQGIFPWWNPYLFGGEPFIANPVVNIWYPATWLFSILPLNVAYGWHLYLHVVWAALGMFMLVAGFLQSKRAEYLGPWVAGVIFGLSGFFMARTHAGHVDVIAAASWMPWVVWGVMRLLFDAEVGASWFSHRQGSHHGSVASHSGAKAVTMLNIKHLPASKIVFASVLFAFQLFAGYQTMAFFTVIIVGIFTLCASVTYRSIKPLVVVGISLGLGLALAALQVVPLQELFRQSVRTYEFPYKWISYGSLIPQSLFQLIDPFFFGTVRTYAGPPPNMIEHSMFVGLTGLVLAFLAIVLIGVKKVGWVGVSAVLCVVFGLWVSLGPNAPFDLQKFLWQTVPMYQYIRIPPRHLIIVVFGLSVLAGIGFSYVVRSWRRLGWVLVGVIIVEMLMFGKGFIELAPVPESRHDKALIELLKKDTQPNRVIQNFGVWLDARDALDFDSVMSYGIFSATGYDPSISRAYYEYVAGSVGKRGEDAVLEQDVQVPYVGSQSADYLDRLNVKYIMVPDLYDPFVGNSRYEPVLAQHGYKVYENTNVMPRFFLENPDCGNVVVTKYTPNTIALDADLTCETKILSSEVYYPGWTAFIDGKNTDISVSEGLFRTLFVPQGKHTIVYKFFPTSVILGGGISLITAMLLLFWIKKEKRSAI